jgi:probable F420-dependent oxidoreductase
MRRLWAGETIDYQGPAGRYPNICLGVTEPTPPPLLLAAIGPKTLALAGRHFDGAVLHPFLTVEGVARSVKIVRQGAAEAGRDPARLSIVATVVVAPELSREERLLAVEARAVTYFSIPDVAGAILRMNGWDAAPVEALLANPQLAGLEFQRVPHAEFIERISKVASQIPRAWASEGAAVGTARQCAERLRAYRDAGVDELLLHGTTADRLTDVLCEYSNGT